MDDERDARKHLWGGPWRRERATLRLHFFDCRLRERLISCLVFDLSIENKICGRACLGMETLDSDRAHSHTGQRRQLNARRVSCDFSRICEMESVILSSAGAKTTSTRWRTASSSAASCWRQRVGPLAVAVDAGLCHHEDRSPTHGYPLARDFLPRLRPGFLFEKSPLDILYVSGKQTARCRQNGQNALGKDVIPCLAIHPAMAR